MKAIDYAEQYSSMEDGDLAQLAWDGADSLNSEARLAYDAELSKRGVTAQQLKDKFTELAPSTPPPEPTRDNIFHALWFALKEIKLRNLSSRWPQASGLVNSVYRSGSAPRRLVRAEVGYRYFVNGTAYHGLTVRDFVWSGNADRMLSRFSSGETVEIRFNPDRPEESYLPSGSGFLGPIIVCVYLLGLSWLGSL